MNVLVVFGSLALTLRFPVLGLNHVRRRHLSNPREPWFTLWPNLTADDSEALTLAEILRDQATRGIRHGLAVTYYQFEPGRDINWKKTLVVIGPSGVRLVFRQQPSGTFNLVTAYFKGSVSRASVNRRWRLSVTQFVVRHSRWDPQHGICVRPDSDAVEVPHSRGTPVFRRCFRYLNPQAWGFLHPNSARIIWRGSLGEWSD